MLQEFDPKVFNILFLRALPGLSVVKWEKHLHPADVSGAKKWEGARLARTSCPGWRAYGSTGYGAKVFVSVISSSKPSDIENFGLFRSPLRQQEVVPLLIGTQVWR